MTIGGEMPRGISRVFAMARPRRPACEAELVRTAAPLSGSAAGRALALARRVVALAMIHIDQPPEEQLLALMRGMAQTPLDRLALDPDMGVMGQIVAARLANMEARGGTRLREGQWAREDAEIRDAIAATLAKRYANILRAA